MYKIFAAYFAVTAITLLGVEFFRRWSLKRRLLDIPNERSSHTVPTPRGGGIIIFSISILSYLVYSFVAGDTFYWAYFAGAMIIAFISLLDDFREISPNLRVLFHSFAAGLVVWFIGGFEIISIPFYGIIRVGILGNILTFVWIVGLITVYNFMDGIDGIAATQAVIVGIGWCLLGMFWEVSVAAFYGGILAASALGFLFLNWQTAKIFMGDVGSAFLGYSFAVLPLFLLKKQSAESESNLPWIAVVFVWLFVFDMLSTFFKRFLRLGWRAWEPHREHIYQKMVDSGLSHAFVTGFYGTVSVMMVFFILAALKYSLHFEVAVLIVIAFSTASLLLAWRTVDRSAGKIGKIG